MKDQANLYVTSLIDVLYKAEELVGLKTADVTKDERYMLVKGNTSIIRLTSNRHASDLEAVKHKF